MEHEQKVERHGLTEAEAAARLAREGPNEFRPPVRHGLVEISAEALREPMFQLLLAAAGVYLLIGGLADALMLLGFALVNIAIMVFQERRTERVLDALRDLTSPRAVVVRDGERRRIAGREVVRGDLLLVEEGDRVPADARILTCNDLEVDESLLTGESVPVRKRAAEGILPPSVPGGDDLPYVYAATMVVRGQGLAEVLATGLATEVGKIGSTLGDTSTERPAIEREIKPLVQWIAIVGTGFGLLVLIVTGLARGNWLDGLLAGITLAMSLLPQEFPLVMAVFLTLGAWRLSQRRVLTRRPAAIESLGAATVLCVDKTGTLTENRMSVVRLFADGERHDIAQPEPRGLPESFHELLEFGILASEREPFDPMERAFLTLGDSTLGATEHLHRDWELAHEYALSAGLPAMSHVWKARGRHGYVVAAKGAPEAIVDLCHLAPDPAARIARQVEEMAAAGLRVLAVAKAQIESNEWPTGQHDFDFEFVGLIGLADPLRAGIARAVAECHNAGMRVVMITGDHPMTAHAIAAQAGLMADKELLTGEELNRLSDTELAARIENVAVFARTTPEQKLRIVTAFKARGEIVAMTGDGVNDAPSLKAAHIGIAMGQRGADVAREAAALVLLDDDFASIVAAARLGRRIFDNLGKAMTYLIAVHVPIAGLALIPLFLGWPLVLTPIHIVFLELVIDPVSSIVFEAEPEEPGVMRRPPRGPAARVFGLARIGLSVAQGLSVLAVLLAVLGAAHAWGHGENEVRALVFVTLVVANIGLILANRSASEALVRTLGRPNRALWWAIGTTLGVLGLVLGIPELRALFHFATLHGDDLTVCLGVGAFAILWSESLKLLWRRLGGDHPRAHGPAKSA